MKIRNQLFLIFLALGVTLTLIISFLIYIRGKRLILEQVHSSLEAVSQTKKVRLEEIIQNQYNTLELIASSPFFISHAEKKLRPDDQLGKTDDSATASYIQALPGVVRVYITNTEGKVFSSSDTSFHGKDLSMEESFMTVQKKGRYLNGFFYTPKGDLCLTGGVEMKDPRSGKKLGNLFMDIKANDFISVTNDYTGLGTTGETVLAKMYQQPTLLTPTRSNPEAGLNVKIPKNDPMYDINLALEGKEEIVENALDYRQKPVIAFPQFLPDTEWAIVTKMDMEEAYKSIGQLRNYLLMLNFGLVVLAVFASYFISRYLARPVEELAVSAKELEEGHLTSRLKYSYNNELGTLAETFNNMADKLERKIKEFDKVGYLISHDLKAPLNSIIPLVDFIREDNKGCLGEETEKMLSMIKTKSFQMNELIREISEKTRPDKKIREHVDVDALVGTIISNLNPDHIQIFIQHNLPLVYYHKISLMQVFQNLIHNAVKYMDKEKGVVNIGYADEKESYKFWVSDNGPGVRTEVLKAQEHTGGESPGLGLAIARKVIEENGGKIWVESSLGEGSTFYFTIPKL